MPWAFWSAIAFCFDWFAVAALACFCLDALLTDFGDLSPMGTFGFWGWIGPRHHARRGLMRVWAHCSAELRRM